MTQAFEGLHAFEAVAKAETWCRENGYSVGAMQANLERGILKGDYLIAKWRNLTHAERMSLDGVMSGDMRYGPVTVTIYEVER